MKSKHYVNMQTGLSWLRCKRVEFKEERAVWELNPASGYSLVAAYKEEPHRELIQAVDDDSLRVFVRKWGPLRLTLEPDKLTGSDPIAFYRRERDQIRAWALLFDAIRKGEDVREATIRFLRSGSEPYGVWIRQRLGIPSDSEAALNEAAISRLALATENEVFDICNYVIGSLPTPAPSVEIQRKGNAVSLRPAMGFYSLGSALTWMIWQDIFNEKPFGFCPECGDFINFTTKHYKEFCGYECAHRKAARESARRKREEKRKNGTSKAR